MLVEVKKHDWNRSLIDDYNMRNHQYTREQNTKEFRQWWAKNWREEVLWMTYQDCMSHEVEDRIIQYAKKSPNRVSVEEFGGEVYVYCNRKAYLDIMNIIDSLYDCYESDED